MNLRDEIKGRAVAALTQAEADLAAGYTIRARNTARQWNWQKTVPRHILQKFRAIDRQASLLERNETKSPKAIGMDQYGFYFDFTGHEAEGYCFWCGIETKGRYCCEGHRRIYLDQFHWMDAKWACWHRSRLLDGAYSCADCRTQIAGRYESFVVHHVFPIDGEDRNWHWLNRPQNLVLLCKSCHGKRHAQWNYLMRRASEPYQNRPPDPQLEFRFMDTQGE